MNILGLIIQLLSGAAGGNIAGAFLKKYSLGPVGNTIVGVLGGGLGGQLLSYLGAGGTAMATGVATSGLDVGAVVSSVLGGGVGGGILMVIVALVRQAMHKTT